MENYEIKGLELLRERVEEKEKKHPILTILQQHKQRRQKRRQYQQRHCPPSRTVASLGTNLQQQFEKRQEETPPERTSNQGVGEQPEKRQKETASISSSQEGNQLRWIPATPVKETKDFDDGSEELLRVTVVTSNQPNHKASSNNDVAHSAVEVVDSLHQDEPQRVDVLESLLSRRESNINELKEHYEKALKECDLAWQVKYKLALDDANARLEHASMLLRRQGKKLGASKASTKKSENKRFVCSDFVGGKILACTIRMDVDEDSIYDDESCDDSYADESLASDSITSSRQSLQAYFNLRAPWLSGRAK